MIIETCAGVCQNHRNVWWKASTSGRVRTEGVAFNQEYCGVSAHICQFAATLANALKLFEYLNLVWTKHVQFLGQIRPGR